MSRMIKILGLGLALALSVNCGAGQSSTRENPGDVERYSNQPADQGQTPPVQPAQPGDTPVSGPR